MSGEVVVFTGTLVNQTRKEATAQAEARGYIVTTTVTKETTILVCGEKAGKKAEDAKKKKIRVYTEAEWVDFLREGDTMIGDVNAIGEGSEELLKDSIIRASKKSDNATAATPASSVKPAVVFTGTLLLQSRKEAIAEAESHGYSVGSGITRTTTFLVCGDKVGDKKLEEAKKLGIVVLVEEEWKQKLVTGGKEDVKMEEVSVEADMGANASRKRKAAAIENENSLNEDGKSDEPKIVVFTGTLVRSSRKEATAQAEVRGFRVQPKLTKATMYLICGERAGQKLKEAERLNVQVLTEVEWEDKLATLSFNTNESPTKKHGALSEKIDQDALNDVGSDIEYDEETGAINGVKPKELIPDGVFRDVKSASGSMYLVKRLGSVYSCSCPAWRNQRHSPTQRTCKHLKAVLGEAFESARVKSSVANSTSRKASSSSTKVSVKTTAPKVLLANKWDREKNDPVNWWISEKLDGVRAFWDAKRRIFLSRLGNEYPAPEWFTKTFPSDVDLDGEIFGGRGRFQFTVGIAKTSGSKHWDQLVYKVFDAPSLHDKTFEERMKHTQALINRTNSKYIEWVEHTKCKSLEHLDQVFDEIEKAGGEGLMIRQPGSKYIDGRSSTLLKIKSFHDGEAEIIAFEDGKGKYIGMVGALRCKMASGKMFKVASGLSDQQRSKPPAIGSIIVYKCQELTNDGIPRFPVFVGVAADKTCAKDPVIANAMG